MTTSTTLATMCPFTIHHHEGNQSRALESTHSSKDAHKKLAGNPDGDYTIRDCLGGLRAVVRVTAGVSKVIEVTR